MIKSSLLLSMVPFCVLLILSIRVEAAGSDSLIKEPIGMVMDVIKSMMNMGKSDKESDNKNQDDEKLQQRIPATYLSNSKIDELKMYLDYSASAYCNSKNILKWTCSNCIKNNMVKDNTKVIRIMENKRLMTSGYIAYNRFLKKIIVAYEGSQGIVNYATNFMLNLKHVKINHPTRYKNAKVHYGFYMDSMSLLNDTIAGVSYLLRQYPSYNVTFVGHSLGGAIATINMVQLINRNLISWKNTELYTFGQPRTGNSDFANYIDANSGKTFRVVNKNDMVPSLPSRFILGYRHIQTEIYIQSSIKNSSSSTVMCKKLSLSEEDPDCSLNDRDRNSESHLDYWGKIQTTC